MTACPTPAQQTRRSPYGLLTLLPLLGALLLAGCGGGSSSNDIKVTSISASPVRYNATMTITVNGSGLTDPNIGLALEGPCENITRLSSATDFQVQFTCRVSGTGEIRPNVVLPDGSKAGSVRVTVPVPQVTMSVRSGITSGTIVLELDPVAAPISVNNFLTHVSSGLYRNTIFHRVLADVLAQGGGYTNSSSGLLPVTNQQVPIVLEPPKVLKNQRGTIAMARTAEPDSATSQFFFNLRDNPEFDYFSEDIPGYAVFGRIISGIEVAEAMSAVPTTRYGNSVILVNVPVQDITITAIAQTQ